MNKNKKLLEQFIEYCETNPEQRFWQALRNWSEVGFVYVQKKGDFLVKANAMNGQDIQIVDTFYFEDKTN